MMGLVVRKIWDPQSRYRVHFLALTPSGPLTVAFKLLLEVLARADDKPSAIGDLVEGFALEYRLETQAEALALRPPPIQMPVPGPGTPR